MKDNPSCSEEFLIEQFRQLHEEMRTLNRFAWQIPLGVLGAVGLCLSGLHALDKSLHWTALVWSAGLIVLGIATLGFTFLMGRFHARRGFRREEGRKVQNWYKEKWNEKKEDFPIVETLPNSCDITRWVTEGEKAEKESFGGTFAKRATTPIGMVLLLFVAILLIAIGLVVAVFPNR